MCRIPRMKWFLRFFVVLAVVMIPITSAQLINTQRVAQRNFADCQKFYLRLNDAITAESQCRSAVQYDPDNAAYHRLFARILLDLNKYSEASASLGNARAKGTIAEDDTIEAEIAFQQNNLEATITAASKITPSAPTDVQLRAYKILGLSQKRLARFDEALLTFKKAVELVPSDVLARRELADLYLENDPKKALALLTQAPDKTIPLLADLGRAQWITGDLENAIQTLEEVAAKAKAFNSQERPTYQKALGALAYSYFGQGRFADGQRVMNQMDTGGNWFSLFISRTLPWLLGIVLLLVLHLIGEARIEPLSTIEILDGPRPWSVGTVYAWLIIGILAGGIAALFVGNLMYNNFFAILTPNQSGIATDVFLTVMILTTCLLSFQTAKTNGWKLSEVLFGATKSEGVAEGIAAGILLIILALGYQFGTRQLGMTSFFTDVLNLRISLIALIIALPLAEIFFRAFALYPLEKRYGVGIGSAIAVTLFGLSFIMPLPFLLLQGGILVFVSSRVKSTIPTMVAQVIFIVGLLICVTTIPIVRNWF
jgi:Flp pilus assembly protein TadD